MLLKSDVEGDVFAKRSLNNVGGQLAHGPQQEDRKGPGYAQGVAEELPSKRGQCDVATSKTGEGTNRYVEAHPVQQERQFQLTVLMNDTLGKHQHQRKWNRGQHDLEWNGKQHQRTANGPKSMTLFKPFVNQEGEAPVGRGGVLLAR